MNIEKHLVTHESAEALRDTVVTIHLMRHGKKELGSGVLSEEGEEEAVEKGVAFEPMGTVKAYTSDWPRVTRTAELVTENIDAEHLLTPRLRKALSASAVSSNFIESDYFTFVRDNLNAALAVPEEERETAIKNAEVENIQKWLAYGGQKPDEHTSSPEEVAEGVAALLQRQLGMTERVKDGSRVDLFDVTHEFMLAACIRYFLSQERDDERVGGDVIMAEMGHVPYLCDIQLKVTISPDGEKKVVVTIEDKEYLLDEDKIADFATRYSTNTESE